MTAASKQVALVGGGGNAAAPVASPVASPVVETPVAEAPVATSPAAAPPAAVPVSTSELYTVCQLDYSANTITQISNGNVQVISPGGGNAAITPETAKLIESLTGIKVGKKI